MSEIFREVGLPAKNINNLSYSGPALSITPILGQDRAPSSNNYRFPVNTFWNNTDDLATAPNAKGDLWYMAKKSQYQATWVKLSGGGSGPLLQFTPSSGIVVTPNALTGNVNVNGSGLISVTGTSETLTVGFTGSVTPAVRFTPTSGIVVTPNVTTGNVNVSAGAGITVTGTTETLTIALAGGGVGIDSINVDASTFPGTDPVLPDGTGQISIFGAQVTANSIGTAAVRTNSLAPNTFQVEVQRSAAAASSSLDNNGLCSFDSTNFTVDANGWVQIVGSSIISTINTQSFTTPGAFTYTATAGMSYVIVELCAGGGGGGGTAATTGSLAIAGGGAGGAYAKFLLTAAQVGPSLSGSVGAAGTGAAAGNNAGGTGGSTTLATSSPWTLTGGTGGTGGASGASATVLPQPGGTVTAGTGKLIISAAGSQSGNGAGTFLTLAMGCSGGSSLLGVGGQGIPEAVASASTVGSPGNGYGSGAGGSIAFGTEVARAGTAGQPGIAIFTEFI